MPFAFEREGGPIIPTRPEGTAPSGDGSSPFAFDRDPFPELGPQFKDSIRTNPDEEVKKRQLEKKTGVPRDILDGEPEHYEAELRRQEAENVTSQTPVTRQFLANTENAQIAHDDAESLASIETFWNSLRAFVSGIVDTPGAALRGIGEAYGAVGTAVWHPFDVTLRAIGLTDLADALQTEIPWYLSPREIIKRPGQTVGAGAEFIGPKPEDQNFITDVAGGLGQVTAQITAAILTGGISSGVSLGILFGQGAEQQAEAVKAARAEGKEVGELAEATALLAAGGVTAVLERTGLDVILNRIPAAYRSRIFRMFAGATTEAAEEIAEGIMQNLITMGLVDPEQKIAEGVAEAGTVGGTVGAITSLALGRRTRFNSALDNVHKETAASKLNARSPADAAEHRAAVVRAGEVGTIFVPIAKAQKFVQKHPKGVAEGYRVLGVTDPSAFQGNEVAIDAEHFAKYILGTENYDALRGSFRIEGQADLEPLRAIMAAEGAALDAEVAANQELSESTREQSRAIIKQFAAGRDVDVFEILNEAPADVHAALDAAVSAVQAKLDTDLSPEVLSSRERELDKRIASLDAQIATQSELIVERQAQGKPVVAAGNKLNGLLAQRDELITEQTTVSDIRLSRQVFGDTNAAERLGRAPVETRAERLEALNVKTQVEGVRALRRGFREGRLEGRKDIKQAQRILSRLVNESNLSPNNKSKFITTIRDMDSVEKLEAQLPTIQSKITNLLEEQRKRESIKAIRKLLKNSRTRIQSGKPQGNMTPEISGIVDRLFTASRLNTDLAKEKLALSLGGAGEVPGPVQVMENQILMAKANLDLVTASDLEQTLLDLEDMVERGRAIGKLNLFKKHVEQTQMREKVLAGLGEARKSPGSIRQRLKDIEGTFLGWNAVWEQKWRRMLAGDVDDILEKMNLFEETRVFEQGKIAMTERWTDLAKAAMGANTSERQLLTQMQKDATERVKVGTFTHSDGVAREIVMTRSELRSRFMELQNPDLNELIRDPESNAYTDEIVDAIRNSLTEQDIRLVTAQQQFYNEYYDRINKFYEKAYGVSLERVDNYVPIRRQAGKDDTDEFMKAILYRGNIAPGSLKSRTPSKRKLIAQSDFQTLQFHILQMEYFIAYHDKVQFMNQVVNGDNAKVASRIAEVHGQKFQKLIESDLEYFSRRAIHMTNAGEKWLLNMLRNFSFAQLAAKPQIGLKQLMSFPAFAEEVNTADFLDGVTEFASNPRKALKFLRDNSDYFRNRGINIDQDYTDLTSNQGGNRLTNFMGRNPRLTRVLMLPIRYGDKGAIAIGGFGHIQAKLKKGASIQEAVRSFERIAVRTQQSSDPDQVSELQRMNSFARILTQFMSSANALTRAEYQAFVEVARGRISRKEFMKRFFIYHILIPNLIMYVANAFHWDTEDQLRASILGTFNGVFVLNTVIEGIVGMLSGDKEVRDPDIRHPLSFAVEFGKAAEAYGKEDVSFQQFMEGSRVIDRAARGSSILTGLPIATILNEVRGIGKVAQGQLKEGGFLMLGYSPYTIKNKTQGGGSLTRF